jgi:hypothetical protein
MASTIPIFEAPKDRQVLMMEIVRFACPIYRSTKIPASHVALLSSIQVNDRADVALLGAEWV